ncbi:glycosyl hydrolase family 65 protein [Lentisphaerota bacterium ZTH]|nr:glycoside hydrolase family 65 protein [Lentisphaerota bacterium]WET07235.1 glycosyl hydrolase family 65 protein [Lentisphaerota bacterium ZTH]
MKSRLIAENQLVPEQLAVNETLFHVANGYIGVRGSFEEGVPAEVKSIRGTYINAFYDTEKLHYEERYTGFPDYSQCMLNVIDAQSIKLYLDDEEFSMFNGRIVSYQRTLDAENGTVNRTVHWVSPQGREIILTVKRMASFAVKEAFLISYHVKCLNFKGLLNIISNITADVSNMSAEFDPRLGTSGGNRLDVSRINSRDDIFSLECKTRNSGLSAVCTMSNKMDNSSKRMTAETSRGVSEIFEVEVESGDEICLEKFAVYTDSVRFEQPLEEGFRINREIYQAGFKQMAARQRQYLDSFWKNADITIEGDAEIQNGIRFNMYQLLQSASNDKYSNIAAKGLSGEGYEGHYFWDTETYIYPFFLFTNPGLAKNLLMFRYNTLDGARKRAREMAHSKGALFPWRTINGDECSAYFPSGTAQYHINTDIAHAVIQYWQVTGDTQFMADFGAEILFETARVLYDVGHFRNDGKFVINEVTGPDEYTACVNNNYYTNLTTQHLFEYCDSAWKMLKQSFPAALDRLAEKINIVFEEIAEFKKAACAMYLPFDKKLQIHPQDDSFLERKVWDLDNTPKEKFPLLLHYHPLHIYRHQVCKQPDTVLAHFLLEGQVPLEIIKNDYYYYEKITTHDSSLSTCIFSIMASRIGDKKRAYDYFSKTARLDLDNLQGNTEHGIHTAAMGGMWMAVVFGFGGMRFNGGQLYFRPNIPDCWKSIEFKVVYRGRVLQIKATGTDTIIKLLDGDAINIYLNDKLLKLEPEEVTV